MTTLSRYTSILRLLGEEHRQLTVPEIAELLDSPTSSVYRTVRELLAEGLLDTSMDHRYRLGPAVIELDRRLRLSDPLIQMGERYLRPLAEQVQLPCSVILARLYADKVMCVADYRAPQVDFQSSYQRGRLMPLLRGATSKAILAHLPPKSLHKLLTKALSDEDEVARLTQELRELRKSSHCIAFGEVDAGLVGIAAPIHSKQLGINASLSLILREDASSDEQRLQTLPLVVSTAKIIAELIDGSL